MFGDEICIKCLGHLPVYPQRSLDVGLEGVTGHTTVHTSVKGTDVKNDQKQDSKSNCKLPLCLLTLISLISLISTLKYSKISL